MYWSPEYGFINSVINCESWGNGWVPPLFRGSGASERYDFKWGLWSQSWARHFKALLYIYISIIYCILLLISYVISNNENNIIYILWYNLINPVLSSINVLDIAVNETTSPSSTRLETRSKRSYSIILQRTNHWVYQGHYGSREFIQSLDTCKLTAWWLQCVAYLG